MKLKIEVELDYIDEDGTIDDEIKKEIVAGISKAISGECLAEMTKNTKDEINMAVTEAKNSVNTKVIEFVEAWLDSEKTVTDQYGDPIVTKPLREIVKGQFDDCLNKKVDRDGHFTTGYGANGTLLEYLTKKRVEDVVESKLKGLNKDIDEKIAKLVNAGIRARVSDKFAEMVILTAKEQNKERLIEAD